jgi:xylan 1,4-beta-xylosidase
MFKNNSRLLVRILLVSGIGTQLLAFGQIATQHSSHTSVQALVADPVVIQVDLTKVTGQYKPIYSWFGYDEANYTTMRHGTELLKELHDLSPVPVYIRVHHLFTSGDGKAELKFSSTNVYAEDASGRPKYDFTILDGIFDAYMSAGVRPLVELGFMPKDLAAELPERHEPYQVHYPQSTVSGKSNNPPKDYEKWAELVRVVTAHLVQRYGRDQVLQWYFEVWNEPDIDYWHADAIQYLKLYDYSVAAVRAALPGAKVGGPASTGPGSPKAYAFLDTFLKHASSGVSSVTGQAVPLDFISFHAKGRPAINGGTVTMGISNELNDVNKGFELIASYPKLRSLPIILSEADPEGCAACSSKVNPANNYRNGTLYPAYTAVAYKALFGLQDLHNVNLISMLSWSFEFEDKDYFEGFRSLATNGIDKPVLNVFRMFAMMSGNRVEVESTGQIPLDTLLTSGVRNAPDVDALATAADHEAAVLAWNYHDVAYAAVGSAPTRITVTGIPAGVRRVRVEHYRIDQTHSNSYTAWQAMGSPQQPTAEQYARLKASGQLELFTSPEWLDVTKQQITIATELPRQSISLLHIQW